MAPPPHVPEMLDELVEEILLRFPPDDPASLVRAALVCKLWCRLVSAAAFRRRFRGFHRRTPLLGVLCQGKYIGGVRARDTRPAARFVPTSSFHPAHPVRDGWRAVDARQGRVLLECWPWGHDRPSRTKFVVWDPVTNKQQKLPTLVIAQYVHRSTWTAAVVCTAGSSCSHRYCNGGSFMVVFVGIGYPDLVCTSIYSSKTGAWSKRTWTSVEALQLYESFKPEPGVLMGNTLYFLLFSQPGILKYDLTTREVSVIDIPLGFHPHHIVLMTMEDGTLGFAAMGRGSKIYIRSRVVGPDGDDAGFTKCRVIDLPKPLDEPGISTCVSGFAHDVGVLFIWTCYGLYSMDIKSEHVRKLPTTSYCERFADVVPYLNFHTPGTALPPL
ncbi:unnamed protein product [Urochloa decumbens]|uniref:F-box domain-containing protein n=1 Tax=Urochloa decumbens TaxID=240449 RepID=A0ABC9GX29_9POAL